MTINRESGNIKKIKLQRQLYDYTISDEWGNKNKFQGTTMKTIVHFKWEENLFSNNHRPKWKLHLMTWHIPWFWPVSVTCIHVPVTVY